MKQFLTTNEIKQIELSILDYIDSICKENSIKYYLAYGTLLGAVRHKGFIPWDDDIDIYMLRDDYMKLIQIMKNKKENRYQLLSIYNDLDYTYEFVKVVDVKTSLIVKNINHSAKEGVWVDVFPLDTLSKCIKIQKFFINIFVACRILSVYQKFPFEKRSIVFYPLWIVSKIIGPRYFLKVTDRMAKMGRNDEMVGYMASMGVSKYYFPKEWCLNTCLVDFEGKKYPAFEHYDEYLKFQYGNYMQLPPEDKRVSHPVDAYWR